MGSTEKINVLHLPFGCEDAERWEIEVPGRYDVKIEKGKIVLIKKADPKFKEGDWIVNNETGEVHQVIKCNLEDDCYLSEENIIITFASERMWHKWTIFDAKAGDVLVEQDFLLIFEKFIKDNGIVYLRFDYDYYNPHFTRVGISSLDNGVNISPATKEQMKPLLGYMAEAGYVFDTEKLELRKKAWKPKEGAIYYYCYFDFKTFCFKTFPSLCSKSTFEKDLAELYSIRNFFQTEEEAQAFCDKLNAAIKPVIDERKKELGL